MLRDESGALKIKRNLHFLIYNYLKFRTLYYGKPYATGRSYKYVCKLILDRNRTKQCVTSVTNKNHHTSCLRQGHHYAVSSLYTLF